jgi:hypothetical protein
MFIPDTGSLIFSHPGSPIPDPKTKIEREGKHKVSCIVLPFIVAIPTIHKILKSLYFLKRYGTGTGTMKI